MSASTRTDLSYLKSMSSGDNALVIELIELFLENAPVTLQNMEDHCQQQQWSALAAEAHKLKPNLAYMGMEKSKSLILELEKDAKEQQNTDELAEKIKTLKQHIQEARTELQAELKKLNSSPNN